MSQDAHQPDNTPGEPILGPSKDIPSELPLPPLPRPPFWLIAGFMVMVVLSWLPLALIARARVSTSEDPRIHILQDMGKQPKYREQETSEVFADGRADRGRIPDTVARGMLDDDDHLNLGFTRIKGDDGKLAVKFYNDFPVQITVDQALLERGQQRFNIYCSACHGYNGQGNGTVNQRAIELSSRQLATGEQPLVQGWVPPANLVSPAVTVRPNGHIFNTITNGIRSMPSYSAQISVSDRWAIVAYVRALQVAQNAPLSTLTPDELKSLTTH